jgi:anti-sigma factor RsiW
MVTQELTCKEMVELVTDYFDGALSRSDRRRFERHLDACDGCTTYVEQMRRVVLTLGELTEDSIPPAARDALLHAVRDWKVGA